MTYSPTVDHLRQPWRWKPRRGCRPGRKYRRQGWSVDSVTPSPCTYNSSTTTLQHHVRPQLDDRGSMACGNIHRCHCDRRCDPRHALRAGRPSLLMLLSCGGRWSRLVENATTPASETTRSSETKIVDKLCCNVSENLATFLGWLGNFWFKRLFLGFVYVLGISYLFDDVSCLKSDYKFSIIENQLTI